MLLRKIAVAVGLSLGLVGCGGGMQVTEVSPAEQNLQYIVMAYQQAATDLGRSPRNLDELRPFLTDFGDPDAILSSTASGQPYTVIWDLDLRNISRQAMPIVAYDAASPTGQHLAIDLQLATRQLSGDEVAALPNRAGR